MKFEPVQGYDAYSAVYVTLINQYLIKTDINAFNYTVHMLNKR